MFKIKLSRSFDDKVEERWTLPYVYVRRRCKNLWHWNSDKFFLLPFAFFPTCIIVWCRFYARLFCVCWRFVLIFHSFLVLFGFCCFCYSRPLLNSFSALFEGPVETLCNTLKFSERFCCHQASECEESLIVELSWVHKFLCAALAGTRAVESLLKEEFPIKNTLQAERRMYKPNLDDCAQNWVITRNDAR